MISWMQKNNKFLIITIWIATISFIFSGATSGFSFGIRNSSVGKVGDVELSRDRLQMDYSNLFNQYNQMLQGKFDQEQAKQMGLQQKVLNSMAAQAKILNLANEFGIMVTEEEVAKKLASIPAFQTDTNFDRQVYDMYIQNSSFHRDTFEKSLHDQLVIEKTLDMLNAKGQKNEYKAFGLAFEVADKLKYTVLSNKDVNITIDEKKLKEFWKPRKGQYQTARKFTLDIQWTETQDTNVSKKDIETFYEENKFNYTDKTGKILSLKEVEGWIEDDVKIKKSKKVAFKRYVELKKGKISADETLSLDLNNPKLSPELWNEINKNTKGTLLKPKVVNKRYASVKIVDIIEPITKTFEEVKGSITPLYREEAIKESIAKLAEKTLSEIDKKELNVSTFITFKNAETQDMGIKKQEIIDFASKLFTSNKEKGIIPIGSKVIVYKIIEQKRIKLDENVSKELAKNTDLVKEQSFEKSLLKMLDKKYPTEFYK